MNPLVSVIIPVYNGERYLVESIESVLAQKEVSMELIVVDDGSTDKSGEIIKSFGSSCRYIYQKNQGASSAKNTGIAAAQGRYLSFNDADDLWSSNKLSLQLEIFKLDPSLDMVFGHVKQFHSPEMSDEFKKWVDCPEEPMLSRSFNSGLIKKECFFSVGLFSPELTLGEGIDWTNRALQKGCRYQVLPDILSYRRLHEYNQGMHKRDRYNDYLKIAKLSLDMRRLSRR